MTNGKGIRANFQRGACFPARALAIAKALGIHRVVEHLERQIGKEPFAGRLRTGKGACVAFIKERDIIREGYDKLPLEALKAMMAVAEKAGEL